MSLFTGTKSFVVNAELANTFLVLAQTRTDDRLGDKRDTLTVFIVDRNAPGVKVQQKHKSIGHRDLFLANVTFDDVILQNGTHTVVY